MNFATRSRTELWQLLSLVGFTLLLPLVLPADPEQAAGKPVVFDQERYDQAAKKRPDIVMIGNSMLNSRIDKSLINHLIAPNVASFVAEGGTRSAVWWFMLKNFVGQLPNPPKLVFIFYRDYDFTSPGMHLDGEYLRVARTFMKPDDQELLDQAKKNASAGTPSALAFYLPDALSQHVRGRISDLAIDIGSAGQGREGDTVLQERLNNLFDFDNLRPDILDAGGVANDIIPADTKVFSVDPANSFLGLFNDFAHERKIQLVFYRVKRRPDSRNVVFQEPELRAYTASFQEWAESEGHRLIDETEDPRLTLSMYHDGDHLARGSRPEYTRIFVERIRSLLPASPVPEGPAD